MFYYNDAFRVSTTKQGNLKVIPESGNLLKKDKAGDLQMEEVKSNDEDP